jgi:hypothetical protein
MIPTLPKAGRLNQLSPALNSGRRHHDYFLYECKFSLQLDTLDGAGVLDGFDGVAHLAEQANHPEKCR